ncbi:Outer membrane cobalamin translocator [Thalassovita gelatinovora]|uniref:Outer membrane cobalamin translocator n=1 Tax=Thalassovita gelatinovora TaxID=53501 RepID=A0A0N7LVV1_THAGE|nr:TonB-dependent receptor [Thalassovita gelatinovora]QIZ81937.1 TonB-dependent receptor [Thalassovita gelatinovora]CUH67322.1 Outer membrane cobalamin translocator [Thalassovita gelatinovora]SEP76311.1 vitamin B12 transporter [Thalassovita gelatinovora]
MLRSSLLASVAIAPFFVASAMAQDAFALDEIIVTGGLSPIEAQALGRASSVVTARQIEERGITTVQDALRALPGVSVNGASNTFTQVRIRGGEVNHTLILIDGIEAAGGDGEYILSGLETANIERIEVLRGPQSVYYGSNASAGVINIITRKGETGGTYSTTLEVGAATTATAFVARRGERGGLSLSFSHTDDQGYDQSGDGGEKDGSERTTMILSGDYLITDDLKLGFTLRRAEEDYEFDATSFFATDADSYIVDDPTQSSTRDETTAGVFAEYEMMGGRLTHRLAFEKTEDESTFNGGAPTTTQTQALKYRLSFGLDGAAVAQADHLLNLLVENKKDSSSSNALYERESNSIALEYRGSFAGGLDVQAGARFDNNDVFEDATTWNVGLSYQMPGGNVRLHASAGTGIVNPSYFELYASAFGYAGNSSLTPERNKSFDIGAEFALMGGRSSLDVTYFNETLTDEITAVSIGPGTYSFINQTGDSDRHGVEVSGSMQATDAVTLRLAYTYIDAQNPDGSVEIRRPKHELTLGATVETFGGRGTVSADIRHVSGNYDTQFWGAYSTVELPAYTTVDISARYELTKTLTLNGRITNLFDDDAVDVWGYASRGRAAYVGVSASF